MKIGDEDSSQNQRRSSQWCECGKLPCMNWDGLDNSSLQDQTKILSKKLNECYHCNEAGTYRPLLGNEGEIMCDVCYREIFPLPEVIGEQGDSVNEEEECRICLEVGVFRSCCSQYYCQPCYYKSNRCPGCQRFASLTSIGATNEERSHEPGPGRYYVGLSWFITFAVTLCAGILVGVLTWNELSFPETYFGRKCYGFFPSCDRKICVEVPVDQLNKDMPLTYKTCDLESTMYSIIGDACVYDNDLFQKSGELLG